MRQAAAPVGTTGDNVALAFGGSRSHLTGVPSLGHSSLDFGRTLRPFFRCFWSPLTAHRPPRATRYAPAPVSANLVHAMAHAPAARNVL